MGLGLGLGLGPPEVAAEPLHEAGRLPRARAHVHRRRGNGPAGDRGTWLGLGLGLGLGAGAGLGSELGSELGLGLGFGSVVRGKG